jgi:hypothetical protein
MKKISPYLLVVFLFATIFLVTACSNINYSLAKSENGEGWGDIETSSLSTKSDVQSLEKMKGEMEKEVGIENPENVNIKISNYEMLRTCGINNQLKYLGAPEEKIQRLADAIKYASFVTSIPEELIVALIKTESNFKAKAISSKKYKGLMQTPSATFIYFDVDILHGCRIFEDKLRIAKGNMLRALSLYKGGDNPVAMRYAKQTYNLYTHLLSKKKTCITNYKNNIFSHNFSDVYSD